jgi:hypothetical protein
MNDSSGRHRSKTGNICGPDRPRVLHSRLVYVRSDSILCFEASMVPPAIHAEEQCVDVGAKTTEISYYRQQSAARVAVTLLIRAVSDPGRFKLPSVRISPSHSLRVEHEPDRVRIT